MKKTLLIILIISALIFTSCSEQFLGPNEEPTNHEVFEHLWKGFDERYSFFAVKEVDWDSVYYEYLPLINEELAEDSLGSILGNMLAELNDRHISLASSSRFFNTLHLDIGEEKNFDLLIEKYFLEKDVFNRGRFYTGPFMHTVIHSLIPKNANIDIGYINYSSFHDDINKKDLKKVLASFSDCKGLIFDIRSNGGGYVENLLELVKAFNDKDDRLIFYSQVKNGKGHEDFTKLEDIRVEKADKDCQWLDKPIVLLIDNRSYSCSSFMAMSMEAIPNAIVIGDTTGGGLGIPGEVQLPNGWIYSITRSRSSPANDPDNFTWENGVPPDKQALLDDYGDGIDGIIEAAIEHIVGFE